MPLSHAAHEPPKCAAAPRRRCPAGHGSSGWHNVSHAPTLGLQKRGGDIEHIQQFVRNNPGQLLDYHAQYADRSEATFANNLAVRRSPALTPLHL